MKFVNPATAGPDRCLSLKNHPVRRVLVVVRRPDPAGGTVPLSEEELRLLEQMERALVAEDPKLASTMRGATLRATARRRALIAAVVFVIGIAVLMTGAVTQVIPVGIVGFVVMLASAYVALSSWRGQDKTPERGSTGEAGSP